MDARLRRDTVIARCVSETSVNLPAHTKPLVRKHVDSLLWEVYRNALVAVVLWLALVGLALLALSTAATRDRPMVAPLGRLQESVTPGVQGTNNADGALRSINAAPSLRVVSGEAWSMKRERSTPPGSSTFWARLWTTRLQAY